MFLGKDEVVKLTGHRTRVAQAKWLKENHFKFFTNAKGQILVPRAKADKRTQSTRYTTRKVINIESALTDAATFSANEVGVYLLIDDQQVVYIGKTTNLFQRVAAHQTDKQFDSIRFIRLHHGDLDIWERELIAQMTPKYNKLVADAPQSSNCAS